MPPTGDEARDVPGELSSFDRQSYSIAAAEAERGDAAFEIPLLQGIDQRGQDARAAGADRVAERDGAAIDVHSGRVDPELLDHREQLDREGFVDLEEIHIVQR